MGAISRALALVAVHKLVLLGALFTSPFIWDTSSLLVLHQSPGQAVLKTLASRVMAWDCVYYVSNAYRGLEFEHEYAFSQYWARLVRLIAPTASVPVLALTASAASIVAHVMAVILLLKLSSNYMPENVASRTAWLYTLSPAGVFLVAGYPESLVAALSFAGLLLCARHNYVLAGAFFAVATLLRANGLLWGFVFLAALLPELARGPRCRIGRIASIVVGGLTVGAAFVVPQAMAYAALCPGLAWCDQRVPSIYSYIQTKYWNNGLFHYWVFANIPNFLLGMPTLALLLLSSRLLWRRRLYGLVCVQVALAVVTLFFWHAQIVTRIASCVPGPYWYVSELLGSSDPAQKRQGKLWTAYFGVYGVTQAALFGAFLPPA